MPKEFESTNPKSETRDKKEEFCYEGERYEGAISGTGPQQDRYSRKGDIVSMMVELEKTPALQTARWIQSRLRLGNMFSDDEVRRVMGEIEETTMQHPDVVLYKKLRSALDQLEN